MNSRVLWLLASLLLMALTVGLFLRILPNHYNPFADLELSEPVTFVTQFKIAKLKTRPQACIEVLQNSQLDFEQLPDQETGQACGFVNVLRLKQSTISYGGNITLSCPALVALMMWEKNHVQTLAKEILGQEVKKINHYGTYACRNINNTKKGKRSQHAFANAIDIAGFQLADGEQVSVLKHWHSNTKEGEFVRAMHSLSCDYFTTVLGPKYNDLHRDHFHFDMGPSSICR